MMDTLKPVEESKWTKSHTYSFIAFAIGLLLEGYIFGLAPVATSWYIEPNVLRNLLLAWPYLWLIIGIAFAGPISDKYGRKRTFIYSMTMYGIGGVLLAFSINYMLILISLAILLFAAGAEMNVIMIMAHEIFPRRSRSKSMMMLTDFISLASVILAAVGFISISTTVIFGRVLAGITVILTLIALVYVRWHMPESIRWLEKIGNEKKAQEETQKYFGSSKIDYDGGAPGAVTTPIIKTKNPPIWFKETVATLVAFANTVGFGLMTYALAPIYFPSLLPYIFLIAGVAGVAGGFLGLTGDRLSRKWLLSGGYVGVLIITVIIVATLNIWSTYLLLFWILLIALNILTQIAYMTEDTLKGELWPTKKRGTLTAVARVISIGAYIPIIFYVATLTISQFLIFNMLVWAIGAVAAVAWHIWGVETGKGVSIGVASGEA